VSRLSSENLITLLSDFGDQDVYVGVMKGIIARVNPRLTVIDLTHQIPAQAIGIASFHLAIAYRHFPRGTVHVAVVDPGVGSHRRGVAVQIAEGFLVGPDNGLWTGVLQQSPAIAAVELTQPQYWYTSQPSSTFHGRDIFAPVGAHLAMGVDLQALGPAIAPPDLIQLSLPEWVQRGSTITGSIQAVDGFGNLITNIPGECLQGRRWSVNLGNVKIESGGIYSDSPPGELLSLVGSHGWLEIAVNGGNAHQRLQQAYGARVQVKIYPSSSSGE
jgi:S-adenosyl-L-methionine hydrolase (adenosine-forming)